MSTKSNKTIIFDTAQSYKRAAAIKKGTATSAIESGGKTYVWSSTIERIAVIRERIPYRTIEQISKRLNLPIKSVLFIFGMPQTTYNKKVSENSLLDSRDSELIVLITELLDYGINVFNDEEDKFQRWLQKPNISLGGNPPQTLLDTITGINEVKFALNRIEFGNFA